jgi:alpha-L-rhamnosidase
VWGVSGNYRSIPTDCPQRDERQGWLGDRSAECKGETYLFNTEALYAKWLQDMADAQKDTGSVPDVCPAYWPIYSDNVTWPSSTVIIPGALREQFADEGIIASHYASARRNGWTTCAASSPTASSPRFLRRLVRAAGRPEADSFQ